MGVKRSAAVIFHSYNKTEDELDRMDRKLKLWTYYRELIGQVIVAGLIVTMIWFGASLLQTKSLQVFYCCFYFSSISFI